MFKIFEFILSFLSFGFSIFQLLIGHQQEVTYAEVNNP